MFHPGLDVGQRPARETGEVLRLLLETCGQRSLVLRAALTRGYPRNFETAEQISRGAAQLALYDLPDDYFSTFVPRILAVDEEEVTRVASEHIDPSRLLTVIVGDREKVGPGLPALSLGEVADVTHPGTPGGPLSSN